MAVAIPQHAEMHAEHRLWMTEHSMWRDDIQLWREDLHNALASLSTLEESLREQERALDAHLDTIVKHEGTEHEHERTLAAYAAGINLADLDRLEPSHQAEAQRHRQQRDAHERIKKHHHTLIARWSLLLKSLQEAM